MEGLKGLNNRTKAGRPSEMSEEVSFSIKKELSNSNQGWTTKQVKELIIKVVPNITILTYIAYFENGDLNKRRYQEKYMLIPHLKRKKRLSKKGHPDTCG
jgi:hypothetical protein